ncbi:MAG: class IV adenylate cyclase [Patescibacteria group bacterium]|nr:class IV adenylate cyclase [Patescibacteria group bacterium]MDD5715272.1 class IV adenylate cyclase [Patescibacteria group bacterium]
MEIELKARVSNFSPIERNLKKLGARYIGVKRQIDTYFLPIGQPYKKYRGRVLRIRYDALSGQARLELHVPKNAYAAQEYEVAISNYRTARTILEKMKFRPEFVIDKRRRVYRKGQLEIVLDTVKRLGKFIEVELEGTDTQKNRKRITDFMLKLGVKRKDFIIGIHYNRMMLKVLKKKYAYF